ncbi:MAG: asparagine--tRNA ligase [Gammaproteobacteria bacterium]|nr:asparagine--tRNA ligase [Gammaproteobacteria bacterium]MCP5198402.1 asparagine--tRNA ligase [Gammaproteobacteria bacterium]
MGSLSFRERVACAALHAAAAARSDVLATGWVRTKRESKGFAFLEINDGSCLANLQVVIEDGAHGYADLHEVTTGTAVAVRGDLVESPGKGQRWELKASALDIIGRCDADFPLQKKRHSDEFLRSIAHLRARTNKYGALARIRSRLSFAIHDFFQGRGFHYVHTPIITGSDCEGAGEMFRVTSLDPYAGAKATADDDFFGKEAHLTVSGQLSVETYCLALSKVYTFGPTFRAENSNTSRHMAEFWMIEPELAFADIHDDMQLAEELVRHLVDFLRADCAEDLALFGRFVEPGLDARLAAVAEAEFARISYGEAIELLRKAGRPFEYPPEWGGDLQTEHERFLTEEYFKGPVFVHDWPKDIKAFYMRLNDDERTVAAMDLLVPHSGELVGGSAREERRDVLARRIAELGFDEADYWWYLDTRRFGSVPHAGFGLGFERFLMFATGVANIRDVIPFPRTPRNLDF